MGRNSSLWRAAWRNRQCPRMAWGSATHVIGCSRGKGVKSRVSAAVEWIPLCELLLKQPRTPTAAAALGKCPRPSYSTQQSGENALRNPQQPRGSGSLSEPHTLENDRSQGRPARLPFVQDLTSQLRCYCALALRRALPASALTGVKGTAGGTLAKSQRRSAVICILCFPNTLLFF